MGWFLKMLGGCFQRKKSSNNTLDLSKLQEQLAPHFTKKNPWMALPKKSLALLERPRWSQALEPGEEIRGLDDIFTKPVMPPLWEELRNMSQGFTAHLEATLTLKANNASKSIESLPISYAASLDVPSVPVIESQQENPASKIKLLQTIYHTSPETPSASSLIENIQHVVHESAMPLTPPKPKPPITQFDVSLRKQVKWPQRDDAIESKPVTSSLDAVTYFSEGFDLDEFHIGDYQMQNHRILANSIQNLVDCYFQQSEKEE